MTNFVDPISSWQDYTSSASQIPSISWNKMIHYHIQRTPALHCNLNHINSVHTIPSYFFKICFNISSLPSMFSKYKLYSFLFSSMYATGTDKFISLDWNNLISFDKAYNYESSQYAVGIDPSVCQIRLALYVAVVRITPAFYSVSIRSHSWF
jgi:hypothetical protein